MQRHSKWTRTKTLRRSPSYRPIEEDDVRYLWAAFKKGALKDIGFDDTSLTAEQFSEAFHKFVLSNAHAAWTLFAPTKRGKIPVAVILATWGPGGNHLVVMGMAWLPWATKRNMVESMVGFVQGIRKEIPLMAYALPEHKRMYEVVAAHGCARRVGTSYVVIPGKQCAVFEARKPE